MFLRGPVLYPPLRDSYMLATSLLYMMEFYNKWVLGEQTVKFKGEGWGTRTQRLYIKGYVSIVNLTGAA